MREGVFGGDGLCGAVGDDRAVVDAASELVEAETVTAEPGFESGEVFGAEVAYGFDVQVFEIFFGDFAYAGYASDGKGQQEGICFLRLDDEEAVGLAPVGGDLGEEFVGGYAGRGGEVELVADLLADGAGYAGRCGESGFVFGDVEIGLVEGERFDEVGVLLEDFACGSGDGAVASEVRRDEDCLGQRRSARIAGMAERTPKARAS